MTVTGVLYDLISGTAGAVLGALVMTMMNYRRNKRLVSQIETGKNDLEAIRLENERLLRVIAEKESQILSQQNIILDARAAAESAPKQRTKTRRTVKKK